MFVRERVALGNFRGDCDEALVFEAANGGGGGFGEFEQFAQGHFAAFLDEVPDFALAFGQLGKFAIEGHDAHEEAFAPAGLFLAHGFGQDAFQGNFGRTAVILADPAGELEDFGGDKRLRADDFQDGPQIDVRGFLGERGDATKHFARAELHLHAAADVHLSDKFRRNEVIKLLAERELQCDPCNHEVKLKAIVEK